jgi:hypothetical protein
MWRVALALTVAAVAAPVAQATSFEDRVGSSYQSYANSSQAPADGSAGPDAFMRAVKNHADVTVSSASPEAEAVGRYADSLVGDSTSAIEAVRLSARGSSSPQAVEAGFQWDDAAIGSGFALGLMLLGGAAFLATRHISRPITA